MAVWWLTAELAERTAGMHETQVGARRQSGQLFEATPRPRSGRTCGFLLRGTHAPFGVAPTLSLVAQGPGKANDSPNSTQR